MCLGGVSTADLSLTTHPHEHDHHRAAGGHPAGFCCSPRVRAGSVMDIRRGPDVKRARSGRAGLSHHMGPGGVTTPDTKPMRIGAQEFLRAARRARGCPILRWKRAMTLGTPRVCGLPRQSRHHGRRGGSGFVWCVSRRSAAGVRHLPAQAVCLARQRHQRARVVVGRAWRPRGPGPPLSRSRG